MKPSFPIVLILGSSVLLSACHSPGATPPAADPPATARSAEATPADLVMDDAGLKAIKIETLTEQPVARTLTVAGKIQFDEDRLAHIIAPLAGQVVDLRVKVGDLVQKGQALLAINSREATAAIGEHVESHKDLELAEKTAAMTQDLFDHQAASKIALQQAQSDLAKATSRVARNEQTLRVLGLQSEADIDRFDGRVPVLSPIRGVVIDRHVTDGVFVQSDSTPMITVADLSTVWVVGDVFERDLSLVMDSDSTVITTTAFPGERFAGRVNYISDVIDPMTRTAKVRVSVPNPRGRLKPEMFASIALGVGAPGAVLTVPAQAVFTENGRSWVYVATAPGHFVRRLVDIDQDEGAQKRVRSGLRAGDRVVTDGGLLLREEEEKRAS
jgi:cobalt-zinc-cadmium efflux system membrane fusion protein